MSEIVACIRRRWYDMYHVNLPASFTHIFMTRAPSRGDEYGKVLKARFCVEPMKAHEIERCGGSPLGEVVSRSAGTAISPAKASTRNEFDLPIPRP